MALTLGASAGLMALSWHRYRHGAWAFAGRRDVAWSAPVLAATVAVAALGTAALTLLVPRVLGGQT